jgi:hypothetical protein
MNHGDLLCNVSTEFNSQHRVLAWLAIGEFHHIIFITIAAAVDICLQLSISAQAVGMASSSSSFHHSAKHVPHPFTRANLGKMSIKTVL